MGDWVIIINIKGDMGYEKVVLWKLRKGRGLVEKSSK